MNAPTDTATLKLGFSLNSRTTVDGNPTNRLIINSMKNVAVRSLMNSTGVNPLNMHLLK